jgi:hypothetical protein
MAPSNPDLAIPQAIETPPPMELVRLLRSPQHPQITSTPPASVSPYLLRPARRTPHLLA